MKTDKKTDKKNFVLAYIILKIQNGSWKPNEKIASERQLSKLFNLPNSFIHNCMCYAKNLNLINNKSKSGWFVNDFNATNLLGFEPYQHLNYFSEIKPIKSVLEISFFNIKDFKIFKKIDNKIFTKNKNFYYLKKDFYKTKVNKISHTMHYVINMKRVDFFNENNLSKNLLKFFGENGLALMKRVKKIVCFPISENDKENLHQKFYIVLYNIGYDQFDDLLFLSKTTFFDYEFDKSIEYFYSV